MNMFRNVADNFRRQGVLTQIIIMNVAVFLTVNLVGNLSHLNLVPYLALPIGGSGFLWRFWTFFTYMFTHADLWHLFWNMILFYFMSQVFFTILGQKKLLYLYVMSGLFGGALMLVIGLLLPSQFGMSLLLGASAAVMGVGAVMAVYSPDYRVFLFGMLEMRYRYFYVLIFVLNTVLDLSVNTGGKISHVGGALFGVIYGIYLRRGTDLSEAGFRIPRVKKLKVIHRGEAGIETSGEAGEQRMNLLLDKISKSGYDSLTKSEKEELFRLSQRK
jgi:membrane associated rhomboid family serine protease